MKAIGNIRIKNRYTGKGYVGSDLAWCVAEIQSTLTISAVLQRITSVLRSTTSFLFFNLDGAKTQ